jgi:hypothetical protein
MINGFVENGGAIRIENGAAPVFRNCMIAHNNAVINGGAIYCAGGFFTQFYNCEMWQNNADLHGGAVYCTGASIGFEDCEITWNWCGTDGGAIYSTNGVPVFSGGRISYNSAGDDGGGLCIRDDSSSSLINCELANNEANGDGGHAYCYGSSYLSMAFCTMHGGNAPIGSGFSLRNDCHLGLIKCILAFGVNGVSINCDGGNEVGLSCSDVYGNEGGDWIGCIADQYPGNDNLWEDPLFCDPETGLFTLRSDSPCAEENNPACGQIGVNPVGCTFSPIVDGDVDPGYGAPKGSDSDTDGNGNDVMDVTDLHVIDDEDAWYFHFTVDADIETIDWGKYALYIDVTGDGQGATHDAWMRNVVVEDPHKPEYGIYTWVDGEDPYGPEKVQLWSWNGTSWDGPMTIEEAAMVGGRGSGIEWKVSKVSLGYPATFWCEVWSTSGDPVNAQDTINDPPEDWNAWDWETTAVLMCATRIDEDHPTDVDPLLEIEPTHFALRSIYPNPATNAATITFDLPEESRVELVLYDTSGRLVRRILDRVCAAGRTAKTWQLSEDGCRRLPAGIYFLKMETGRFNTSRKIILLGQ